MTRVVGGSWGGRRLVTPAGETTRPTSEKVRAALASSLYSTGGLVGARVLDLYAGSGALGLELVSRGASSAVFVERDRAALAALRENVAALGGTGGGGLTVLPCDVAAVAGRLIGPFDVADARRLIALDDALGFLPAVALAGDDAKRAGHGVAVPGTADGTVRLVDTDGLIALAEPRGDGTLKPVVGFRG